MKNRIIFLDGRVEPKLASLIIAKLLLLENDDKTSDIKLYINSQGGEVPSCFAIVDTIQTISPDVSTICTGWAASAGAIILMSGKKGKRCAYPNSEIMIHQPSSSFVRSDVTNLEIKCDHIQRTKKQLNKFIAENTGQFYDTVKKDTERDKWMSSEEARKYGIVDYIVRKR